MDTHFRPATNLHATKNGDLSPKVPVQSLLHDDGVVGIQDFLALLDAWEPCTEPCPPCAADLDFDCEVGITDFLMLLANWG